MHQHAVRLFLRARCRQHLKQHAICAVLRSYLLLMQNLNRTVQKTSIWRTPFCLKY